MLKPAFVALALALSSAAYADTLSAVDTNKDGTIDLGEAKTAAGAVFDKLDRDHDGTLDRRELKIRISEKDWATADPDHDKTISKDEYLNYVEMLFKAADKDSEGTLDRRELRTPAGRKLEKLLQ